MGQTADQIEDHIESERRDLRSNLSALRDKVKAAVDWRQQFRDSPAALLAVAFGGGLLLAHMIGGSKIGPADQSLPRDRPDAHRRDNLPAGQVSEVWHDIQSALIGLVAAKITDTLAEVVPGFKGQIAAREGSIRRDAGEVAKH
jgi:hypothetical protein